ncbi:uncharacterized protein I206_103269 [Kwoniella pini CBS 10737]|uniref:RAM signaling network component n=1 Tax=Kwoniella pini CBS 10737 TaxID=1296096 RepID=A0A1B9IA07_9TREE|nr:uncharacterized protein I206_01725 [Kwoniella pini CBS 10737]OCF52435.1 hypothetical protein I206_01725 [Kwoniella pini CBS 10737]
MSFQIPNQNNSPSLSSASSSTMTPIPSQFQSQSNNYNQNYSSSSSSSYNPNLRVNTTTANNNFQSNPNLKVNSRLRSNSALSPRTITNSLSPINTNLAGSSMGLHGPSKSLGSNLNNNIKNNDDNDYFENVGKSNNSPLSPSPSSDERNDVAAVIRGLRGTAPSDISINDHSPSFSNKGKSLTPNGTNRRIRGTSPTPTTPTGPPTEEYILNKIREIAESSPDQGDTLDISRQNMTKISDEVVHMFGAGVGKDKKGVWRLALSYNGLTNNSISFKFAHLHRLRYLNLKGNYLTEFPKPITELAGLEILDLSKNRISSFPDEPKCLSKLKVLSLTYNKIYTLPGYMVEFTSLKVFKVDHNPIEWPPKEVLGPLAASNSASRPKTSDGSSAGGRTRKDEDLRPWIENMKSWMRQRAADSERLLHQAEGSHRASDDEPISATSMRTSASARSFRSQLESPMIALSSQDTVKRAAFAQHVDEQPQTPTRPFALGRNRSATLSDDALALGISPGPSQYSPFRPRHSRDPSASSFTSPPSASTESSGHSLLHSTNLPPPPAILAAQGHSRGASYTATQRLSGNLTVKKSLPDLRQSHAQIIQDRKNDGQTIEENRPLGLGIAAPGVPKFQLPGRGWGGDMIPSPTAGPMMTGSERSRVMSRKGSIEMMRRTSGDMSSEIAEKRNGQDGPQIDESRNSYFRRLSTLPSSTISKSVPAALLKFIDAIRGILYALSQLHSALRQYLVFAVNERIASVFSRVMEPAGKYMNNLINTLDRFDSMSRRNSPPVHAIRSVIDATKESVAVFAKVIAVLKMQIPALKTNDIRYTRTLLTMIYGSMAEIACSWQSMAPLLSEIRPLLVIDVGGLAMRSMGGIKMAPTGSLSGRTPISPIIERRESQSPASVSKSTVGGSPLVPQVESSPAPAPAQALSLRTMGKSRRQAGSFSSLDVERGMLMGSPGGPRSNEINASDQLSTPGSYLRHRPSESATIVLDQQAEASDEDEETLDRNTTQQPQQIMQDASPNNTPFTIPGTPPETVPSHQPVTMIPASSRQGGHHPSSSSGSSHAMAMSFTSTNPPTGPGPMRKLSVDVRPPTPASASVFDEDLLDVIETATDIAFTCWLKLAEDVGAATPPFSNHQKSGSQSSILSQADSSVSARFGHGFTPNNVDHPRRPQTISIKHHNDLLRLLSSAEQITAALRESLMGLRANPSTYTTTTLPDDAQTFIKTVVKVSELVKAISAHHIFPINVRSACSKLTQSTRECAILIQVSSLRPSNSTPASIPPLSANSSRPISPMYSSNIKGSSNSSRLGSQEDLYGNHYLNFQPHSAGYLNMTSSWDNNNNNNYNTNNTMAKDGLRGLQLPSRQIALSRSNNRSVNALPLPLPSFNSASPNGIGTPSNGTGIPPSGNGISPNGYHQIQPKSAQAGQSFH